MQICFKNCFITAAHSNMGCWIDLDISLDLSKTHVMTKLIFWIEKIFVENGTNQTMTHIHFSTKVKPNYIISH